MAPRSGCASFEPRGDGTATGGASPRHSPPGRCGPQSRWSAGPRPTRHCARNRVTPPTGRTGAEDRAEAIARPNPVPQSFLGISKKGCLLEYQPTFRAALLHVGHIARSVSVLRALWTSACARRSRGPRNRSFRWRFTQAKCATQAGPWTRCPAITFSPVTSNGIKTFASLSARRRIMSLGLALSARGLFSSLAAASCRQR
jgi:hypothetical protein